MIAALVTVELHVPASQGLKAKRAVVKSVIADLRNGLNVSVAEIDHHDLWQRATLGIAIAASTETGARKVAQQVEKIVYREPRVDVIGIDVQVTATDW